MERQRGINLVLVYKLGKALVELLGTALLAALFFAGWHEHWDPAAFLRRHLASLWSLSAAQWILKEASTKHLRIACLALGLDGLLGLGEWWALYRSYSWGTWLVVFSSGTPLPFEMIRIVQRPHFGRIAIFTANLFVVCYLLTLRARARKTLS